MYEIKFYEDSETIELDPIVSLDQNLEIVESDKDESTLSDETIMVFAEGESYDYSTYLQELIEIQTSNVSTVSNISNSIDSLKSDVTFMYYLLIALFVIVLFKRS